ncbi:hypothetical protein CBOM_01928 [Ceraceosorus bombacis]|uniref:Uncharacterized protein n=1 Tax=Ceraceosorus bombacis TaxID=401625 RepID=A0A0N7L9K6_9BASI|nr:hypothetical protein CBOM_01928 [Ceraceosorus bombacis]
MAAAKGQGRSGKDGEAAGQERSNRRARTNNPSREAVKRKPAPKRKGKRRKEEASTLDYNNESDSGESNLTDLSDLEQCALPTVEPSEPRAQT